MSESKNSTNIVANTRRTVYYAAMDDGIRYRHSADSADEKSAKRKKFILTPAAAYPRDKEDRLATLVREALLYTVNEPVLLKRSEEFFSRKPAILKIHPPLGRRIHRVLEQIGGVPTIIPYEVGSTLPQFDTYGDAAIQEIIYSFERCRRSVCRTHVCFIADGVYKREPVYFEGLKKQVKQSLIDYVAEIFWEHAETSYIRLASYWDRVGQFLDFVFFNIRQYERDGFPSVMDRVASNYVRLFPSLESSGSWTALRSYQNSEKPTGLKWLLRRRNLLVHSVHLEGIQTAEGKENPIFTSSYNHLAESVQRKLKPDTCEAELGFLHAHLGAASLLFPNVIDLCAHCAAGTRRDIARHLAGR